MNDYEPECHLCKKGRLLVLPNNNLRCSICDSLWVSISALKQGLDDLIKFYPGGKFQE